MAEYMLVLGGVTPENAAGPTGDFRQIMARYRAWTEALAASGHLVETHKLFPGQGRTLSWSQGTVTDAPFAETKETIGGYYLIRAASLDEAVRIARDCPTVTDQKGFVQVRPVEI